MLTFIDKGRLSQRKIHISIHKQYNLYCHKNAKTSEPCLTPEAIQIDWAGGQILHEHICNLHNISDILTYSNCGVLETQKMATKLHNFRNGLTSNSVNIAMGHQL